MPLRYAIHVPTFAEPDVLVDLAVTAEGQRWDGVLLWDHILGSREMTFPIVDPWVVLGAIAHATTRIRIGTAITPVPRRRPWKLAREVTTLDRLSHGRAILGVGLGNPIDAEYGAFVSRPTPRSSPGGSTRDWRSSTAYSRDNRYATPERTTMSTGRSSCPAPSSGRGFRFGLPAPGRTTVPFRERPGGTG
jgi:hypothetical protein